MNTISNERIEQIMTRCVPFHGECAAPVSVIEVKAMAHELLALRKEREAVVPVAIIDQANLDYLKNGADADVWPPERAEMGDMPLYTTPPAQPVAVPDEHYQNLSELYHAQEKRLFKLAQRIKGHAFDKYSHSSSQAIDVLEAAIFGESDEACRAAMLEAPPAPTDKTKSEMSQMAEKLVRDTTALAVTLSSETDTTSQQFESLAGKAVGGDDGFECTPVADLYELLTKCGECYDYTTSAKVAAAWVKDGYSAREYVKLDRLQEAMTQGSSGEPDGWIPCSERMPEVGEKVLMRISCNNQFNIESGKYKGDGLWLGCWCSTYGKTGSPYQVAHWMPLPSAPEPCK
ncbi:DUF551 domain-containing protein [Cronobacter dublinensis]